MVAPVGAVGWCRRFILSGMTGGAVVLYAVPRLQGVLPWTRRASRPIDRTVGSSRINTLAPK